MRIAALNPPFLPKYSREQRSPAVTKSATLYYPIWLAYMCGVLMESGHDVDLIDSPAGPTPKEEVYRRLKAFAPDVLVINTSTGSIVNDVAVAEEVRLFLPKVFICLVGTHVSATAEQTMKMSTVIDGVCRKEYDYTVRDICDALSGKMAMKDVTGLTWRDQKQPDVIVHNTDRTFIGDLDAMPWVAPVYKKFLRIEDYFYAITTHPVVTIITGRGCPFHCNYCVYPQTMHGHDFRYRSPENVADEFVWIEKNIPQASEIFIEDDTFTVNPKRVRQICQALIDRGTKIKWTCNARTDVDFETLKMMKAANCRLLCVGIESSDQQVLNNVRKNMVLPKIEKFFDNARKAKVLVHGCFMVGNMGETRETMNATLSFAKRLNPDTAQFFPLMVYPGTAAYDWAKKEGHLKTEDYSQWLTQDGMHNSVIDRADLPHQELVEFCDRARKEYYLRPRYLWYKLTQVASDPSEFKRTMKSFKTFAKYLFRGTFSRAYEPHSKNAGEKLTPETKSQLQRS